MKTDTSDYALATILSIVNEDNEVHPVVFHSHTFTAVLWDALNINNFYFLFLLFSDFIGFLFLFLFLFLFFLGQ